MRVRLAACAVITAIALTGGIANVSISGAQSPDEAPVEYTGDVIVKFKPSTTIGEVAEALADAETAPIESTAQSGLVLLEPDSGQSVDDAVEELASNPDVLFAEADTVVRIAVAPTDPHYASYQWSLPQIGLPTAWNTTTGNSGVIIAVLDTGVQSTHPDLTGKVTTGAQAGYNFVSGNTNTTDDHSHGTFVAGIIAANTNNGAGGAGVCWSCRIMAVKVLDNTGSGSSFSVAQGIDWAATHGADVINLSLGGGAASSLQTAVDNAWNAGVVVVAATGNDNGPVLFPAAYSNAIAVGSNEQNGARSSFSNYGSEIDIMAPGGNVLGTLCTCNGNSGGYGTGSGTSFATPHVAGVVGLMIAAGITDKNEIRSRIQTTATNMDAAGFDNNTGWGRINAAAAIGPDTTPPTVSITSPANGATVSGTININATAADNVGVDRVRFSVDATYLGYDSGAPYTRTLDTTTLPNGTHQLSARALDDAGNSTTAVVSVTVSNADAVPPTVAITSPANGATVSGTITINANASDNVAMNKVRFSVDSTYLGYDSSSPYSKTLDTTTLANGTHTLTARAFDHADNVTTTTITINVNNSDTTPPTVSITSPLNGATVSGTITINATAADNVGVNKVRFSADTTYLGYDSSSPYSITLNTTTLSNGTHQLSARALDNAGNSTTAVITVTVAN